MKYYLYIFGLFSAMLVSVSSSDIADKNTKIPYREDAAPDTSIDKRQGGYSNNIQEANQYNVNPYQYDYKGYQNQYWNGQSLSDYDSAEKNGDVDETFTSGGLDRQDLLGGDTMMAFGVGALVTAFAAGAATYALIQNSQQESDIDSINGKINDITTRVSSLESDQTSICTSVKAFAAADDGKTISATYDVGTALESGYLAALVA